MVRGDEADVDFAMEEDNKYMRLAIEQANRCTPTAGAYSVGAVLVNAGQVISVGYSRELAGNTHAEECALVKLSNPELAVGSTLYTTMEPCSLRLSGKESCTARVVASQVSKVVVGIREPPNFVNCTGTEILTGAGIQVTYLPEFAELCRAPNKHLL